MQTDAKQVCMSLAKGSKLTCAALPPLSRAVVSSNAHGLDAATRKEMCRQLKLGGGESYANKGSNK